MNTPWVFSQHVLLALLWSVTVLVSLLVAYGFVRLFLLAAKVVIAYLKWVGWFTRRSVNREWKAFHKGRAWRYLSLGIGLTLLNTAVATAMLASTFSVLLPGGYMLALQSRLAGQNLWALALGWISVISITLWGAYRREIKAMIEHLRRRPERMAEPEVRPYKADDQRSTRTPRKAVRKSPPLDN